MNGRARASMRKAACFIVCTLLCTALLASPGAWAKSFSPHSQEDEASKPNKCFISDAPQGGYTIDSSSKLADDKLASPDGAEAPAPDDVSTAEADGLHAAVGTTFEYPLDIGTHQQIPFTFKVLSSNEVQVGSGKYIGSRVVAGMTEDLYEQAIAPQYQNLEGKITLPDTVTDKSNTSFSVTAVANGAFRGCGISTTGLAGNTSVKTVGYGCYMYCQNLTTTGLEDNKHVTSLDRLVFNRCYGLTLTGLYENDSVDFLGGAAFQYCSRLKSTGLEKNTKLTCISDGLFGGCTSLESTGLAQNKTVTTIKDNAFARTPLTSTGLEHNTTVKTLGSSKDDFGVFQHCEALTSTGLESNHSVSFVGKICFIGCTKLGTQDVVNDEGKVILNAGDLRLNGGNGSLAIETNAFLNTKYDRIYFASDLTNVTCAEGAFDLDVGHKIPTLYVQNKPPWNEKDSFSFGTTTYAKSDGSYIVMDPHISDMKASRVEGTSDSALLSFTANHGFKTSVKHPEAPLGDYNATLSGTETGQMQEATCTIPTGAGLTPGPEELRASLDKFIYPLDAKAQDYNSLPGTSLSCTLDPVTYTIHFDAHGGSGTMDNQQVTYGRGDKLHLCTFSVDNMTFRHWSTDAQDKGPTNASYDNEALTDSIPPQQGVTLTLFAQWQTGLQVLSTHTNSNPLAGVSYELSKSDQEPIQPLEGLSSDPEGQNPIHKEGEEGTCWPLISNEQGKVSMYWLSEGTYYLFNVRVPAGYNAAPSPMKVEVSHKDGKAFVTVNGNEVSKYADATAHMSIAFVESPSLPTTGNLPAGLVQGVGAFIALMVCIALIHRRRYRKGRGLK